MRDETRKPNFILVKGISRENINRIVGFYVEDGCETPQIRNLIATFFTVLPDSKTVDNWVRNIKLQIRNTPYNKLMRKWRGEYTDPVPLITPDEQQLEEMYSKAKARGLI